MKKMFLSLTIITMIANTAFSYEVKSNTSSSYISVREKNTNSFEILYCKQGASECVKLGAKDTYTLEELTKLKKGSQVKAGLTGAGAVSAVLVGAWLGMVGGGILGLKYLSGAAVIEATAVAGGVSGAAITSTGISYMDKLNPYKHYKTAKMISKMNSAEVDYVNDIDAQALWLNSRLNLVP